MPDENEYVAMGIALLERGDASKAIALFKKSNAIRKNGDACFGLAACHHVLGNDAKAKSFARTAATLGCKPAWEYLHPGGGQETDAETHAGLRQDVPAARTTALASENLAGRPAGGAGNSPEETLYDQGESIDGISKADLRRFIQKNSGYYIDKFERIVETKALTQSAPFSIRENRKHVRSIFPSFKIYLACAVLSAPAYCFYRKMYLLGLAVFAGNILIGACLPATISGIGNILIAPALIPCYRLHANRKIRSINGRGLPETARLAALRQAGGVNIALPIVYLLVILSLVALVLWSYWLGLKA